MYEKQTKDWKEQNLLQFDRMNVSLDKVHSTTTTTNSSV